MKLTDDEFCLFNDFISSETGLHFSNDRRYLLENSLNQRLKSKGYNSFNEYYNLLKFHPEGGFELRNLL